MEPEALKKLIERSARLQRELASLEEQISKHLLRPKASSDKQPPPREPPKPKHGQ